MATGSGKRRDLWRRKNRRPNSPVEVTSTTTISTTSIISAHDEGNCHLGTKAKTTDGKEKSCCLSTFDELPQYMKDNEFILNYYRVEWPLKEAFLSLLQWHNETLNVWTHLLGFALFLVLTVTNLVEVPQVVDPFGMFRSFPSVAAETNISHSSKQQLVFQGMSKLLDLRNITPIGYESLITEMPAVRWPFYVFLSGSMFCLFSSSVCHLFSCHSHHLSTQLIRLDYFGIALMIITSFIPPIYYTFQCSPLWQIVYLSVISLLGLFTVITLLSPILSSGEYRGFRAILFVSMSLFGIIPAVHGTILNWDNPRRNSVLCYESLMTLFYLVGTGFYVSRVPERFKPGWFDLTGHSHQIFHVFVVLGALAHYSATLVFLEAFVVCDASLS